MQINTTKCAKIKQSKDNLKSQSGDICNIMKYDPNNLNYLDTMRDNFRNNAIRYEKEEKKRAFENVFGTTIVYDEVVRVPYHPKNGQEYYTLPSSGDFFAFSIFSNNWYKPDEKTCELLVRFS